MFRFDSSAHSILLNRTTSGRDCVTRRFPMQARVPFGITSMKATIPEGINLVWNGCTINSGPLQVQLDDEARAEGDNRGELDYEANVAHARFNMRIDLSG